jgi:hypothetical protein
VAERDVFDQVYDGTPSGGQDAFDRAYDTSPSGTRDAFDEAYDEPTYPGESAVRALGKAEDIGRSLLEMAGVTGASTVGSMIGRAVGAPLGPVGSFAGGLLGGTIGGMAGRVGFGEPASEVFTPGNIVRDLPYGLASRGFGRDVWKLGAGELLGSAIDGTEPDLRAPVFGAGLRFGVRRGPSIARAVSDAVEVGPREALMQRLRLPGETDRTAAQIAAAQAAGIDRPVPVGLETLSDDLNRLSKFNILDELQASEAQPSNYSMPTAFRTRLKKATTPLAIGLRRLERSPDPLAQAVARRQADANNLLDTIRHRGHALIDSEFAPLTAEQRLRVQDIAEAGTGDPTSSDPLVRMAGRFKTYIFDPFNDALLSSGVSTYDPREQEIRDYLGVKNFFPRKLADDKSINHDAIRADLGEPLPGIQPPYARGGTVVSRRLLEKSPNVKWADPLDAVRSYLDNKSDLLVRGKAWGIPGDDAPFGEFADRVQNEFIRRSMPVEKETFDTLIKDWAMPEHSLMKDLAGRARRAASNAYLTFSAASQVPEVARSVSLAGLDNTVKGALRYSIDPEFRARLQSRGAQRPGIVQFYSDLEGAEKQYLPARAMAAVERNWNRGIGSAGLEFAAQERGQRAFRELTDSGRFSPLTERFAREMGVTPERLAHDVLDYGKVDTDLIYPHLVERAQFQTRPGEMSHFLRDPVGSVMGQYATYSQRAQHQTFDDVLRPMLSSDPETRQLAYERLATLAGTHLPLYSVSKLPIKIATRPVGMAGGALAAGLAADYLSGVLGYGPGIVGGALMGSASQRNPFVPATLSVAGSALQDLGTIAQEATTGGSDGETDLDNLQRAISRLGGLGLSMRFPFTGRAVREIGKHMIDR